ncbi:MAG: hypothetical protein PHD51_00395 [Patescibacteria group bacterium]|nr:hypothetical protein [Patescibacteria group bacterium]MDD5490673.1 hypothetical protein [Patescibacteria group bacterium]
MKTLERKWFLLLAVVVAAALFSACDGSLGEGDDDVDEGEAGDYGDKSSFPFFGDKQNALSTAKPGDACYEVEANTCSPDRSATLECLEAKGGGYAWTLTKDCDSNELCVAYFNDSGEMSYTTCHHWFLPCTKPDAHCDYTRIAACGLNGDGCRAFGGIWSVEQIEGESTADKCVEILGIPLESQFLEQSGYDILGQFKDDFKVGGEYDEYHSFTGEESLCWRKEEYSTGCGYDRDYDIFVVGQYDSSNVCVGAAWDEEKLCKSSTDCGEGSFCVIDDDNPEEARCDDDQIGYSSEIFLCETDDGCPFRNGGEQNERQKCIKGFCSWPCDERNICDSEGGYSCSGDFCFFCNDDFYCEISEGDDDDDDTADDDADDDDTADDDDFDCRIEGCPEGFSCGENGICESADDDDIVDDDDIADDDDNDNDDTISEGCVVDSDCGDDICIGGVCVVKPTTEGVVKGGNKVDNSCVGEISQPGAKTALIEGCLDAFGLDQSTVGLTVEIFLLAENGEIGDFITRAVSKSIGVEKCGNHSFYATSEKVPLDTQLVFKVSGESFVDTYQYNQFIPSSGLDGDKVPIEAGSTTANVVADSTYSLIPVLIGIGSIDAGRGAIMGEIHDCTDMQVENAVVGFNPPVDTVIYFTGTDPDPAAASTDPDAIYAGINILPQLYVISTATLINGEPSALGTWKVKGFADGVTVIMFDNNQQPL